ncbi:hypothetical protein HDU67_005439, partial [Dinochytrium kinnereticum]
MLTHTFIAAAVALLSAASVNAHYILSVPRTRGYIDDKEPIGPCGSFDTPVNPVAFPSVSTVQIAAFHSRGNLTVNVKLAAAGAADPFTLVGVFAVENPPSGPCTPLPFVNDFRVDLA